MIPRPPKSDFRASVIQELLTTEEAAKTLGIPPHAPQNWRCTGRYDPPYIKVGRLVRYDKTDLEAWILKNRVVAGE